MSVSVGLMALAACPQPTNDANITLKFNLGKYECAHP